MVRKIGPALMALCIAGVPARAAESGAPCHGQFEQQPQTQQTATGNEDKSSSGHQRTAWWKDEKARAEIGFTPDQAAEIDRIFKANMEKARPLRDEVDMLEKALSETMRANTADVSVVAQQVDKVERKRAELNKLRVVMLYSMHRVLTPEQNIRFQAYMERREAQRKKQDADRRR